MSRSYKKQAISNDKTDKKLYHKTVRSSIKNFIRSNDIETLSESSIPVNQEIVNDYNYIDWKCVCEGKDCKCIKEFGNRDKCKRK